MGFNVGGQIAPLDLIHSLRDRFAGNREGFLELARLLEARELELSDQIKQINEIKE